MTGHWSNVTGSASALCTGSPQSYSLDSAAGIIDGDFALESDGRVSYQFNPHLGRLDAANDSFTFHANYADGTHSGTVTLAFVPQNVAPVCSDASGSVTAGAHLTVKLPCIDSGEAAGHVDPLSDAIVSQPAHGSLVGDAATGSVQYVPDAGFTGTDSFSFRTNDGIADSRVATYSVDVNAPPLTAAQVGAKLDAALGQLIDAMPSHPLTVSGRKVQVGSVPAGACTGTCEVTAALTAKAGGRKHSIGSTSLSFAGGDEPAIAIKLNRSGRKLLSKSRKVRSVLALTITSGSVARQATTKVVLRRAKQS